MKKIFSFLVVAFAVVFSSAQSMPANAGHFIDTFFPDSEVVGVAEFQPGGAYAFLVQLDSDITISFDANGSWGMVESFSSDISQVLSSSITTVIREKGSNPRNAVRIRLVPQDNTTVVTFNDGSAFVFDDNGRYLRNTDAE